MARPQKQTVDYFPHDAHAAEGDTLTALQNRFGNDGYAFWFKLLEKLAATEGHVIDCHNPVKWQTFIARMRVTELRGVEIMNLLVEMQAIDAELWQERLIWCDNLVRNVADVYKNRRRQLPLKPVSTPSNRVSTGDNGISTPNLQSSTPNLQSKVKESKVKETILPPYIPPKGGDPITEGKLTRDVKQRSNGKKPYGEGGFCLLTDEEYQKLTDKFGAAGAAERCDKLSTYVGSKGKRYKSHYLTILNWENRDAKGVTSGQNRQTIANENSANQPAGAFSDIQ